LYRRNKKVVEIIMFIDPVCKMKVDEKDTIYTSKYKGKKYYFCSQLCKIDFDEKPEDYIK
jgi:YHS domain-containing protein